MPSEKTFSKCTIYTQSAFGFSKREVVMLTIQVKPYAQYPSAVHVTYKEPRQRAFRGFTQSYKPSLVVLEGWGHPDPPSAFSSAGEVGEYSVSQSKYTYCSEEYGSEFAEFLNKLKESSKVNVLADFRSHDPYAKGAE